MTKTRTRLVLIPAALLLLTASAAACGGDDSDDADGTNTPASTATAGNETATTANETATTAGATETTTPGGDSEGGLFDRLGDDDDDDGEQEPGKSVFKLTASDFEGTVTVANLPPNSLFAMEGVSEGQPFKMTVIVKDDLSYFCSEDGAGTGACIESATGDNPLAGSLDDILDYDAEAELRKVADEQGAEIRKIDGRSIAGRDAECYEFTGDAGEGVACIDEETGRLLFMEGSESETGDFQYELVEFGDTPSESDFEPPFPVTRLGG